MAIAGNAKANAGRATAIGGSSTASATAHDAPATTGNAATSERPSSAAPTASGGTAKVRMIRVGPATATTPNDSARTAIVHSANSATTRTLRASSGLLRRMPMLVIGRRG